MLLPMPSIRVRSDPDNFNSGFDYNSETSSIRQSPRISERSKISQIVCKVSIPDGLGSCRLNCPRQPSPRRGRGSRWEPPRSPAPPARTESSPLASRTCAPRRAVPLASQARMSSRGSEEASACTITNIIILFQNSSTLHIKKTIIPTYLGTYLFTDYT